jgi:hypothetical protein
VYVHVAPHALFMEQRWLQDHVNVRTFRRKMFDRTILCARAQGYNRIYALLTVRSTSCLRAAFRLSA